MFNFLKYKKPEFYYMDHVKIIKGFYTGHKGIIIYKYSKNNYLVKFVTISNSSEYINANEMEKL